MAVKGRNHVLLSISCLMVLMGHSCYSQTDRLLQGQQLKAWNELLSASGKFKLGFFSPPNTTNRYVGIWYNNVDYYLASATKQVVWIANRNTPVLDNSASLEIDSTDGNLKIFQSRRNPIPITSVKGARNTSVTLLGSGNLVLHQLNSNGSVERMLWQSFDYPTDTLLPGMKLGINLQTGQQWFLQSWRNGESPAGGLYTLGMDPNVSNQLTIWWNGQVYWTSGLLLNGRLNFSYSGKSAYKNYNFSYTWNQQEKHLSYSVNEDVTPLPILQIAWIGTLRVDSGLLYPCRDSESCGYHKFLQCPRGGDDFLVRKGFMSGDGFKIKESNNMSLYECSVICLRNCSCVAYAATNRENRTGCEIWTRQTDFISSDEGDNYIMLKVKGSFKVLKPSIQDNIAVRVKLFVKLFVLLLAPVLCLHFSYLSRRDYIKGAEDYRRSLIIAAGSLVLVVPFLYLVFCYIKARIGEMIQKDRDQQNLLSELGLYFPSHRRRIQEIKDETMDYKLKMFKFKTIDIATENFSSANKLGEGGFGSVYKGKLLNGQEIAVKRLSKRSGQHLDSFKIEVKLIGMLQHTNLVRLLGVSLWKEEKILVYEYMPNKSLDFFIFNTERKKLLDWKKRFNIMEGIAQGLLYIHKHSNLKVIHLDLKADNVLLDDQMNPKISDFGLARIVKVNELEANTSNIVGTLGYMAPEYKMNGIISYKADVFSFGVLMLEIVSGERINRFHHPQREVNLVGYAWQLWKEGKGLELTDLTVEESCSRNQVLRCICVGLLCVQDQPNDRPTMSDVVSMLTNDTVLLPAPKQPTFFIPADPEELEAQEIQPVNYCTNGVTISEIEGR